MIFDLPPPIWAPPKPAIIRHLAPEDRLLLGMPFTLGMLPGKGGVTTPYPINASNGANSGAGSASWSHTTTADTTCLVVCAGFVNNASSGNITAAAFNGVALTNAVSITQTASRPHLSIWYLLNPPVGTFTLQLTGSTDRYAGGVSINLGAVTAFDVGSAVSASTAAATASATLTAQGVVIGADMVNGSGTSLVNTTLSGAVSSVAAFNRITVNSFNRGIFGGYSATAASAGLASVTGTPTNVVNHSVAIAAFK